MLLAPSWGYLGPYCGQFEAIWGHVEAIWGTCRGHLGFILGHLGAILGHLEANLKPSWAILEALVATLVVGFGVVEAYMCQYRWNYGEVQFVLCFTRCLAGSRGHLGSLKALVPGLVGHIDGSCWPSWGYLGGLGGYLGDFPGYVGRSWLRKQTKWSSYRYLRGFEPNKFGRDGGKWWQMVANGGEVGGARGACLCFAVYCSFLLLV